VEELRARVAFLEAEVERRGASEAELRRIIAALTSRMPEIEAPRETIPESPVSPQMAHSGGSQQQAEASADGVVVEGARQEGSVTSFLPTPRDKLSILSYAGIVLAATAFFWIGTWPPAFNNFPPANVLALAPILCGVWLGITRRGRPYWIYVLTAVVVGILMLSGVIVDAWRLEGRDFAAEQWSWAYIIPFHFLVPTLLFLSGTLFGDAIKRRALAKSLAETTTDRGTPIPDEGLSLGASAILAAVIAGAASIVAALVDGGP
jgi:hypothetical protein